MSLCDICFAPGICCKGFALFNEDGEEITFWLDGDGTVESYVEECALPFIGERIAEFRDDETGRAYGSYRFSCPELLPNGRCGIYAERPDVCRRFEPAGGSPLCVHSGGAEGIGGGL